MDRNEDDEKEADKEGDIDEKEEREKSEESHSSNYPTTTTIATAAAAAAVMTAKNVVHIGTRRSDLARRQTVIVEEALREAWRERGPGGAETSSAPLIDKAKDINFIVHAMSTAGDKNQVTALHEFGAKALWTQELEVGLLEGSLDMVVHSLKGEFAPLFFFYLFV